MCVGVLFGFSYLKVQLKENWDEDFEEVSSPKLTLSLPKPGRAEDADFLADFEGAFSS